MKNLVPAMEVQNIKMKNSSEMPTLGFIGLGQMGGGMARRLLAAGHRLIAYDRSVDAMSALANVGALTASSPREVSDSAHIVFVCLPSLAICNEVAFGSQGLTGGSSMCTYVELSSIGPEGCLELARRLAMEDVTLVDSPVSGGVPAAAMGTLTAIVSGPADAVRSVERFIGAFSSQKYVVGESAGQAQLCKLLNNMLSLGAMVLTSEALASGVKLGLNAQAMLDAINASTGANSATLEKFPRAIMSRNLRLGARLSQCVKDLTLYQQLGRAAGVPTTASDGILSAFELATRHFGADVDAAHLVYLHERPAGVRIAGDHAPPTDSI